MHGCGWDPGGTVGQAQGAAPERTAASVASRYAIGADGVGTARPGAVAAGSLPRATRSAPKAGAARPGATWPRVTAHVVFWGGVGMSRRRALRAAREARCKACFEPCRGRGWGATPQGPHCRRCRHARAERRYGGSWQEGGARAASPPLKVSRRRRAGRAPPAPPRPQPHSKAAAGTTNTFGGGRWWFLVELPPAGFP